MTYCAHTATGPAGQPLPESPGKWLLLADHLRNLAAYARSSGAGEP